MAPYLPLCLCLMVFRLVAGLPTGAPALACKDMRPLHPPPLNPPDSIFDLNVMEEYFKPGSIVNGYLEAPEGEYFKGFLIQARNKSTGDPLGDFVQVNSSYSQTVCGDKSTSGLTHVINDNKTSILFTWQAPSDTIGNITFWATVVQSYNPSYYWRNITSTVVQDCSLLPDTDACASLTTEPPPQTTPSTQTTPEPGKIPFDSNCGKTKGCFPACKDTGCKYLITWRDNGETVAFEMAMEVDDESTWIGMGFSTTGKMDGTDVVSCFPSNGQMAVEASHNMGYSNRVYGDPSLGVSAQSGSYKDGVLKCQFNRDKDNENKYYLDMSADYYLLVASGPMQNGVKMQHRKKPDRSSEKVDFLRNYVVGESDTDTFDLVKLHGSLMVTAWILFSSIGVVTARYCKEMLQGRLVAGLKMWFHIHRTCMMIAVACVIAAFIIIFVHVGGFSQIVTNPDLAFTKAHPYMGIVVTGLAVINPIMALFRPGPTHEKRPLFNWAHFLVGSSGHLLAVITIFFGIKMEVAGVNMSAFYVMIVYTGAFVLVHLLLTLNRRFGSTHTGCCSSQTVGKYEKFSQASYKKEAAGVDLGTYTESTKLTKGEHKGLGLQDKDKDKTGSSGFSTTILVFHIFLMVIINSFLVAIICRPIAFQKLFNN